MDVRRTAPRLSSDEVALVLRRAADLEAEAEGPGAFDGFEPAAVEEAAREVGLSPAAVRQALAELHAGTLPPARRPVLRPRGAAAVPPHLAVEARLVVTTAEAVHATAHGFLHRQTFDLRRRHGQQTVYRQRTDVAARLRRLVNHNGSVQLAGVRSVSLTVTPLGTVPATGRPAAGGEVDPPVAPLGTEPATAAPGPGHQHLVRVEAELAGGPTGAALRSAATAAAVGGLVGLVTLLSPWAGFLAAATAGILGALATRTWLRRRLLERRRDEVREVLAALLDLIEDPAALPPREPPVSWTNWSTWSSFRRLPSGASAPTSAPTDLAAPPRRRV